MRILWAVSFAGKGPMMRDLAVAGQLGRPFIAIPLDYHFEQEYVMAHRLNYCGTGKLVTLRDHDPEAISGIVHQLMNKKMAVVVADTGMEAARIILTC